jgi:hypothetical protein
MEQPASDFGEYFGLGARADASASAMALSGTADAAAVGAESIFGVAATALGGFATGAQIAAFIHCSDQDP